MIKTKIAKLGENIVVSRFVRFKVGDVPAAETGVKRPSPSPFGLIVPKYNRILLKLSGEAMAGAATFGIDAERVRATGAAKWRKWQGPACRWASWSAAATFFAA